LDKKIVYAVVVATILFATSAVLRVLANMEDPLLTLFYVTYFLVGMCP
jgi:hypothetical protein